MLFDKAEDIFYRFSDIIRSFGHLYIERYVDYKPIDADPLHVTSAKFVSNENR